MQKTKVFLVARESKRIGWSVPQNIPADKSDTSLGIIRLCLHGYSNGSQQHPNRALQGQLSHLAIPTQSFHAKGVRGQGSEGVWDEGELNGPDKEGFLKQLEPSRNARENRLLLQVYWKAIYHALQGNQEPLLGPQDQHLQIPLKTNQRTDLLPRSSRPSSADNHSPPHHRKQYSEDTARVADQY